MSINTGIAEFKSAVSAEKTKLIFEPNLLLIFGGNADVKTVPPVSNRGIFLDAVNKSALSHNYQFQIPEYYQEEWNKYDGYGDLVEFEVDAASLTSQVIIFLESEGSICELGLFSGYKEFRNKIYLVLSSEHYESPSFIVNGPVKLIPEDSVYVLDHDHKDITKFKSQVDKVIDSLSEKLNKHRYNPTTQLLNVNILRHQFLLIIDLLNVFYFLTFEQIKDVLNFLGIALTDDRLKVKLYLLEVFHFINKKKSGVTTYYYSLNPSDSFIDYSGSNEKKFDKAAFKIKLLSKINKDGSLSTIYKHYQDKVNVQ